jgi:hypothetical protein
LRWRLEFMEGRLFKNPNDMKPIMFIERDDVTTVDDVNGRRKGCLMVMVAGGSFLYAVYEFIKFMIE